MRYLHKFVHKCKGRRTFSGKTTSKCGIGRTDLLLSAFWRTVTCPDCLSFRVQKEVLSEKQIDARMVVYDDIIDRLNGDMYDNRTEEEQGMIIRNQIKKMSEKWYAVITSRRENIKCI